MAVRANRRSAGMWALPVAATLALSCAGTGAGTAHGTAGAGPLDRAAGGEALRFEGVECVREQDGLWFVDRESAAVLGVFQGVKDAAAGDVDCDGQPDLVVQWAPDKEPDKARIWVIRPTPHGIEYVWRGSAMSAPVESFTLVPHGSCHRLETVERLPSGKAMVRYEWTGFGFAGDVIPQ